MDEPGTEVDPVRARRHGEELVAAILDAGWLELVETGYARLTVGSVATRARTSEPVLYRRWSNKDDLVLAVLERYRATHRVPVPDTGDLITDLLEHLVRISESLAGFFAVSAAVNFSGLLAARGLSPAQAHEEVLGEEVRPQERVVYKQATARGQIDAAEVPVAILALPYDLLRLGLLMDLTPLPRERIESIVDELFLPLITPYLSKR